MEHHQPAMLNFSVLDEYLELKSHPMTQSSARIATDDPGKSLKFIGVLEVSIHQARNIHNICIYQNQDVYAKFCLIDKPEKKLSTQVITGGGRNPVFSETLRFDVQTMDSALRCEVWMLSRVKNYLEDQLLGFALVPLADVVSESGKPAREFELSSSELFHSHAGFVELSFKYTGTSPEVMEKVPLTSLSSVANVADDVPDNISCELDRIEFPDQEIVNENERMVSEYLSIPCDQLDPQPQVQRISCSLETDTSLCVKTDVDSFGKADAYQEANLVPKTAVSPSHDSSPREGGGVPAAVLVCSTEQPLINITVEPEQKLVQEEIVDLYMKGMQQFTDALAKMKLPMDIADGSSAEKDKSKPEGSSSGGNTQASKNPDPSPKVFYGSRAFF